MIRAVTALTALALTASTLPAAAQWIAVGRWGGERDFRFVPPGTWMVQEDAGAVTVSAEGEHHRGRLEFTCSASEPAGQLRFTAYHGDALTPSGAPAQGDAVELVIGAQRYARVLTYREDQRDWVGDAGFEAGFLEAFAAGQQMELQTCEFLELLPDVPGQRVADAIRAMFQVAEGSRLFTGGGVGCRRAAWQSLSGACAHGKPKLRFPVRLSRTNHNKPRDSSAHLDFLAAEIRRRCQRQPHPACASS